MRSWIVGALLWAIVAPWTPALAAERVALVIGNGAYEHAPRLGNPSNDAKDMAALLGRLGFEVTTRNDAGMETLIRSLKEFDRIAAGSEIAVVFYAGHGIEVAGVNYLVPVDAELARDSGVRYEAVRLDMVTNAAAHARSFALGGAGRLPGQPVRAQHAPGGRDAIDRAGPGSRGADGRGMMVAYAAKAGTTADDGDGRNSPYTAALLRHLEDGDLVGEILNRVSQSVRDATGGAQVPVAYGQLPPKTYFTEPAAAPLRKPTDRPPDFVREWWLQIKDTAQPNQLGGVHRGESGGSERPLGAGAAEGVVGDGPGRHGDPRLPELGRSGSGDGGGSGGALPDGLPVERRRLHTASRFPYTT